LTGRGNIFLVPRGKNRRDGHVTPVLLIHVNPRRALWGKVFVAPDVARGTAVLMPIGIARIDRGGYLGAARSCAKVR